MTVPTNFLHGIASPAGRSKVGHVDRVEIARAIKAFDGLQGEYDSASRGYGLRHRFSAPAASAYARTPVRAASPRSCFRCDLFPPE